MEGSHRRLTEAQLGEIDLLLHKMQAGLGAADSSSSVRVQSLKRLTDTLADLTRTVVRDLRFYQEAAACGRELAEAVVALRQEQDDVDDKDETCGDCGYVGRLAVITCSCYEGGGDCSPESPAPGCFNGAKCCPVCDDVPDARKTAAAMVAAESYLRRLT